MPVWTHAFQSNLHNIFCRHLLSRFICLHLMIVVCPFSACLAAGLEAATTTATSPATVTAASAHTDAATPTAPVNTTSKAKTAKHKATTKPKAKQHKSATKAHKAANHEGEHSYFAPTNSIDDLRARYLAAFDNETSPEDKPNRLSMSFSGETGEISLDRMYLPIRYELGGQIVTLFPFKRNNENADGYAGSAKVNFDLLPIFQRQVPLLDNAELGLFSFMYNGDYLHTSSSWYADLVESGGNSLGVLSPLPDNPGYVFNDLGMGYADMQDLSFRDSYHESKNIFTLEFLRANMRSRYVGLRVGAMVGDTDEKQDLMFTTFHGEQQVHFQHKLDNDRAAAVFGAQLIVPLTRTVSLHFDGEKRRIKNDVDVDLRLNMDGVVTDSQRTKFSDKHYDFGYKAAVGLSFELSDFVAVSTGAKYERWDVPVLNYPVTSVSETPQPVTVSWKGRESWIISAGVIISL